MIHSSQVYFYRPVIWAIHLDIIHLPKTKLYSLMRYNILDTTSSSAMEARKIFKENWGDIISRFLTSASTASFSTSVLADQDTEHDCQEEEIENDISKNVVSKHCFQRSRLKFVLM
jgi:hypothetical protein